MEQKKLYSECKNCWCFKTKRCEGRYHMVEEITIDAGSVIESSSLSLDDMERGWPGDIACSNQLVTIEDGCICLNYAYRYQIRPLLSFTKKEMADFMVHLMEKTWYSIFLQRVFVRRVFELMGWSSTIELDISQMC